MIYLTFAAQNRLLEVLPALGLDAADVALLERRLLPPWRRRARRCQRRDAAIRELAVLYLGLAPLVSGHKLAKVIAGDCRRRPPPGDPRRPLVEAILADSLPNRPPAAGTVRRVLAGLPRRREPKPFVRELVPKPKLARARRS